MDKRVWFSRRAVRLHAVILVVVPAFMALCLWQVSRALDGNELSWAYVFEWPIFAAYAIYMWWRFVHEAPETMSADEQPTSEGGAGEPLATPLDAAAAERQTREDAELKAYNRYLAQLAERDTASEHHVDAARARVPKNGA